MATGNYRLPGPHVTMEKGNDSIRMIRFDVCISVSQAAHLNRVWISTANSTASSSLVAYLTGLYDEDSLTPGLNLLISGPGT